MITPDKREKMENLIYKTFDACDPTHKNTERYREMFSSMSDSQFDKFFKNLFNDPSEYLVLTVCDYEMDITMDNITAAAKVLDIPLFETIAFTHYTMDRDHPVLTKEKVPVGYCHIKRTQQTVAKKNGMSTTADVRSSITGQASGADKNGRESDLENSVLLSLGLMDTLKELNGPRADDPVMKQQMLTAIGTKGYVSLSDLDSDPANKTTLNTVDVYFVGMGLKTDLVTKGLMLKKTLYEES